MLFVQIMYEMWTIILSNFHPIISFANIFRLPSST